MENDFIGGLEAALNEGGHQSIVLVTGKAGYHQSGAQDLLEPVFRGRSVLHINNFATNPQKDDVLRLIEEIGDRPFSAIVAIGGGSVIDVAKLIKCFHSEPDSFEAVLHDGQEPRPSDIPLYVIPTTAGSGAEATHFAVVYEGGVKFSVAHERLLPTQVWLAPRLLESVPQSVAASAALDALCQGIESYWSIHSTEVSKQLAKRAIETIWQAMISAVLDKSPASLAMLAVGANLAGQAINITKTTAPHAISYAFTAHYGVAHGHAVMLTLPAMLKFNEGVDETSILDPRGVKFVQSAIHDIVKMLGFTTISEAVEGLRVKARELGPAMGLEELGIQTEADRQCIVKHGFNPQRVNNNPRKLLREDLRDILSSLRNG